MVTTGSGLGRRGTVYLQGALRAPLDGELRRTVRGLLRRGDRLIVLDLAGVRRIDAAGVGELVRAYNMPCVQRGIEKDQFSVTNEELRNSWTVHRETRDASRNALPRRAFGSVVCR